jgi:hypothetical protein
MSNLTDWRCPDCGWLCETFSDADVRCRCGKIAWYKAGSRWLPGKDPVEEMIKWVIGSKRLSTA